MCSRDSVSSRVVEEGPMVYSSASDTASSFGCQDGEKIVLRYATEDEITTTEDDGNYGDYDSDGFYA